VITVELNGSLGNQMFCRAYGFALEKRGYAVQYTAGHCHSHGGYALDCFNLDTKLVSAGNGPRISDGGWMPYTPAMLSPTDPSTILGCWQSEKYFRNFSDEVRAMFRVRKGLSEQGRIYADEISRSAPSVALHVRRGDYLLPDKIAYHGVLPKSYYETALKIIADRVGQLGALFVFSDDAEWCASNMPGITVRGTDRYDDLQLISLCSHAVIANSSFSWWGAWLNTNPNKAVVAPERWFINSAINTGDLIPEGWIRS
jgi:hypothetical protein